MERLPLWELCEGIWRGGLLDLDGYVHICRLWKGASFSIGALLGIMEGMLLYRGFDRKVKFCFIRPYFWGIQEICKRRLSKREHCPYRLMFLSPSKFIKQQHSDLCPIHYSNSINNKRGWHSCMANIGIKHNNVTQVPFTNICPSLTCEIHLY
jgi:hypothetical protein